VSQIQQIHNLLWQHRVYVHFNSRLPLRQTTSETFKRIFTYNHYPLYSRPQCGLCHVLLFPPRMCCDVEFKIRSELAAIASEECMTTSMFANVPVSRLHCICSNRCCAFRKIHFSASCWNNPFRKIHFSSSCKNSRWAHFSSTLWHFS
jgi:hypothetical protein